MDKQVLLGHGSGGRLSHELIRELFIKHFNDPILCQQTDSAILDLKGDSVAFTTDSFVVDPVFFPGGNIGKLAVAGTVNDLAVSGATPIYLSCAFILEEGFSFSSLETIVKDMAEEAGRAGVAIVAGDTKVVNRGKCDKIFITSTGLGVLDHSHRHISAGASVRPGDAIILNGTLGDHGMAVMSAREDIGMKSGITSDCASLNRLIKSVLDAGIRVKFMRDPTRGGLATVLCELTEKRDFGIEIREDSIPVRENVRGLCELLGFDPLYVANEGKVVMVVDKDDAGKALDIMKADPLGQQSAVIGTISDHLPGHVWMLTSVGGRRIIDMLSGEQLPRIC
jgi:hydrogenase expression/formation protein HypE